MTTARELALRAAQTAIDRNALNPVLLDLRQKSSYTDFLLIVSGQSMRQVEAITDQIHRALKESGRNALGMEGERAGHWMLLDYGDVVVHVFHHPARDYYDLEGLWSDAVKVALDVPPRLRVTGTDLS